MKKILSALIVCVMILITLCSCSSRPYAMKIGGTVFDDRVYSYYMTCYKQYWLSVFGRQDNDDFWSSEYDGININDYLQSVTETAIKARLVSAYLFDFYNLKISDSENVYIERLLAGLLAAVGGEDAVKTDETLSSLGITAEDLKNILIIDSKAGALQDYLYGDDGVMKITDEQREAYYKKKYYRFEHFYLMNYDYDRDAEGNLQYDDDGNAKVVEITDERYEEKLAFANEILERAKGGEDFGKLITEYSEELSKAKYPNGHYLTVPNDYFTDLSNAVTSVEIGEYKLFQSSIGIHIIHRIELDDGAWAKNDESGDFENFESLVTEACFKELTSSYYDKIVVNEEITGKYKLRDMPYSQIWQYFM